MKAYDQIGFLSHVSKITKKPLMLVSVDPDLLDENGTSFERNFQMLDADVLDEIRVSGVAFAEFDTAEDAERVFHMADFAARQMSNIGLYIVLFINGESCLGISQETSLAALPSIQADSRLAM